MNPEPDSLRVKHVFEEAIEITSTGDRLGYLSGTCNGDASLLSRVQTLLHAHFEHEESFLPGQPAMVPASRFIAAPASRRRRRSGKRRGPGCEPGERSKAGAVRPFWPIGPGRSPLYLSYSAKVARS